LVEQRIENPRVGGSIPPQATSRIRPQEPQGSWGFSHGDASGANMAVGRCGAIPRRRDKIT
jgi:hypothetical protein